ncbi:MAG: preprotein translocase subunit SecA [Patescibacteria group bacterium]
MFLDKLFGDPNKRYVKRHQPIVDKINTFELEIKKLSNEKLRAKTLEFKERLKKGESLENLLPEAFACVREASWRTTCMRHFDVQLLGGIVLHQGKIAEMKTGEGKTLVATLPLYLNALTELGCHLVTVNDYLARRDTVWMGQIYYALGLKTACITSDAAYLYDPTWENSKPQAPNSKLDSERDQIGSFKVFHEYLRPVSRQEAYRADITYGTNNEFGFDYLRDNMAWQKSDMVQKELNYAIVDEVDSILIDEARTPLIISAPAEESTQMYYQFARLVLKLRENEDYNIDEKLRAATLTEKGIAKMEKMIGIKNIYEESGTDIVHHLEQALKAHTLFHRDRDYVVKNGEIIIVDEFTGRLLPGRRYSEGLHQAIEAKEGVAVQKESQTLATITFQNYFRLYKKLAGMTGTAATSAEEFANVYKLDVIVVPTHKLMIREDLNDRIYKTELGKFKAVAEEVAERHKLGQPVLIGTTSIEKNERLSEILTRQGIPHQLLNAKNHEKEAQIIAQAGTLGAVTCATNMAGRGVDIILGGNPKNETEAKKIVEVGGLHVIGTERHEARRIDNQLRGRTGRQGDPGSTQFYVSLEDDLMRIFGGDRIKSLMDTLRVPEDQPIENPLVSRSLESAQSKVEANNFDLRKHILEYDDVMNKHREVIYKRRREIIKAGELEKFQIPNSKSQINSKFQISKSKTLKDIVFEMIEAEIEQVVSKHTTGEAEEWNVEEIFETMRTIFPTPQDVHLKLDEIKKEGEKTSDGIRARTKIIEYLVALAKTAYDEKEKNVGPEIMRQIERAVLLRTIDNLWIDHLDIMTALREGIGLRGYGQQDPLVEYKKESFGMFQKLLDAIQNQVVYTIYKVTVSLPKQSVLSRQGVQTSGAKKEESGGGAGVARKKVGRNDPCPCGATHPDGRPVKYKHCHGKNE